MELVLTVAILSAAVVWLLLGKRRAQRRLAEIAAFFVEKNIPAPQVHFADHITYGYPGYVMVFGSMEEADSFRKSAYYTALISKVQSLHANDGTRERPFDARAAITIRP